MNSCRLAVLKTLGSILLLVIVALSACKKRGAPTESPASTAAPAAQTAPSVGINPADLPNHQALYDAITKFMSTHQGRAAKDVNELVTAGLLKPLPPLPAGKRYDLDQRGAILRIVDGP